MECDCIASLNDYQYLLELIACLLLITPDTSIHLVSNLLHDVLGFVVEHFRHLNCHEYEVVWVAN